MPNADPLWRVVLPARQPIPFVTERGARTRAAIERSRIARRNPDTEPMVEHRDSPGAPWHYCPGAEHIPARADDGDADRVAAELAVAEEIATLRAALPDGLLTRPARRQRQRAAVLP